MSYSNIIIIIYNNMSQQSRVKDRISSQFFYNKIKQQQFQDIDLSDENIVKQFTQFLEQLPINLDNLIIIKLLAGSYGLPVIIYFRNFYQKAEKSVQFINEEIKLFNKISSIAKWATNKQQILSINFIYRAASCVKQYKGIQLQQVDLKFIQFVKKLESKNKQLRIKIKTRIQIEQIQKWYQQYNNWINQQKKQNCFDMLQIQSIKKFMINIQQLNMILTQVKNQNKEKRKKSIQLNRQNVKISSFRTQQQQTQNNQLNNHQIQVESYSQEGSSFLSDSRNFYSLNNLNKKVQRLFQSSVSQGQKNSNIQLDNSSYSSFVEGLSQNNAFSKKKCNQNNNITNFYQLQEQKFKDLKYCQNTPKPIKQTFIKQKSVKSDNKVIPQKKIKNREICCRTYFYYEQKIIQMQNQRISYIHAPFPFKKQKNQEIRKVICSFLNCNGGTLYIGIVRENNDYVVVGNVISEGEKQVILRSFRQICQTIQPDILTHKMYNVYFVPLKQKYMSFIGNRQQQAQRYIPGNYVFKVIVRYGVRDQIYSYRSNYSYGDFFPFRNQNQIIHKQGRQLLKQLDFRIKYPLPIPVPLHSYPCQKPQIGQVLNDTYIDYQYVNRNSHVSQQLRYNHIQKQTKLKQKQSYQAHHKNQSPIKQNKKNTTSPKKNIIVHFQADILKTPENINKKIIIKSGMNKTEQNSIGNQSLKSPPIQKNEGSQQKNKVKQLKQSCFFVKGLTKKQFTPVLQKKNMLDKIKMQQSQYEQTSGFVIKTFDTDTRQKLCKMLKKIRQKYQGLQITYDEITLQMNVIDMKQVISKLREIKIQYKVISQNVIKFTYYKDSLKAFIYLKKRNLLIRYL